MEKRGRNIGAQERREKTGIPETGVKKGKPAPNNKAENRNAAAETGVQRGLKECKEVTVRPVAGEGVTKSRGGKKKGV